MDHDPRRRPTRLGDQTVEMWQSVAVMVGAAVIGMALLVLLVVVL
jgi:hypothetical protein